ncbi:MAG: caspase family protein, partial [Ferruginibacter sp.]
MNLKFLLFSILFFSASQISFSQTRHALIVAIGNYPEPDINNWKVINSVNDVPLIKNTLVNSQHFSEKNIQLLIDSEATKKGILDALDKLYASVQKGDIVVIHFSSHGQQLEDDNADEIDGLDEAIVPYGAAFDENPARYKELAEGYIRDDLFGEKVTQLRNKLGRNGDLLVILDACHSGSGTRGVQTAEIRGGHVAMVSSNFNNKRFADTDKAAVFKENEQTKLSADAATYVLISGAQARENNYECFDEDKKRVGSLSYSFSRAMSSLKGNITYQGLFAMIENIMLEKAPRQKPVLEGDGVNRELFGGKYERQQTYFAINQKLSKVDSIVLNAGYVSGITKGSVIHFFDPGTTSTTGKKP